jgi:uncharacterized membrane protein required for colicin V production
MHITTLIFFALLAFFTWRGYRKGFIGSITRVLGWIVAYPAAIIFIKPAAELLKQHTALDGLLVYFIAGSTIFLLTSLLVSLLLNFLASLIPENHATQIGSKIGGASIGVLMGALVGLLVVYVIGMALTPAAPVLQQEQQITGVPTIHNSERLLTTMVPHVRDVHKRNDSFIEASAKKLMGNAAATAVDAVLDDKTTAQITKAFVEDPQSMLTHVQQAANDGQIKDLMADEQIQSVLTTGDSNALRRDPGFQTLMNNPNVQALLAQSDINSETGAQAAAEKMVQAWSRAQTIKHDPRVIAIISDPEFQRQLNSPNKLQLMMNPKLNQLTEIIFSSGSMAANGMGNYEVQDISATGAVNTAHEAKNRVGANSAGTDAKPAITIYRWTDENGQVHYSDKPVKEK